MPVGFRVRKNYNKGPSRRTQNSVPGARNQLQPPTPINATSIAAPVGMTVQVNFDVPVVYSGILPQWNDSPETIHVTAVHMNSPLQAVLTYSGSPDNITVNIPFQDPAFRSNSAGYVNAGPLMYQGG
jgi:hypothetical protein